MSFRMRNLRKYMMNNLVAAKRTMYRYTLNDNDEATLQLYLDDKTSINVPSIYDEYAVIGLGMFTYMNRTDMTDVHIPNEIQFIL